MTAPTLHPLFVEARRRAYARASLEVPEDLGHAQTAQAVERLLHEELGRILDTLWRCYGEGMQVGECSPENPVHDPKWCGYGWALQDADHAPPRAAVDAPADEVEAGTVSWSGGPPTTSTVPPLARGEGPDLTPNPPR